METTFPLEAMHLSDNARTVFKKRYLGPGESPEERAYKVAKHVAAAEACFDEHRSWSDSQQNVDRWTKAFYIMIARCEFSPNSPTWRNAGTDNDGVLSACFVIPVTDSMEGILNGRAQAAYVQKSGGGTGFDFSLLRPEGAPIKTTQGSACGPVRVIKDYDFQSYTFTQGDGAFRRGANMGILRVDHPDVEKFIAMKLEGGTENFNISVAVTNEFMDCLDGRSRYKREWEQCHINEKDRCSCEEIIFKSPVQYTPSIGNHVFKLRHATGYGTRWIDSRVLWDKIITAAHASGDPGIYFPETAEQFNPTPKLGTLNSTNPCGEVPLLAYEPCNLGSINVSKFLNPGAAEIVAGTETVHFPHAFDVNRLSYVVRTAVRFLDDVVTVNTWPTEEIRAAAMRTRKIGLGVMGWADCLAELRIPYDSHKAVSLGFELMQFINEEAVAMSEELAAERGYFPAYDEDVIPVPRRNATVTCIAPTGTISIITDCSSGIEPPFRLEWDREMEDGTILPERYKGYQNWLDRFDGTPSSPVPEYLKGANDIGWTWHLKHQQAFQAYTHLAVSKTINMPEDATVEDVSKSYKMAFYMGLKGTTIYRHNSKSKQVLTEKSGKEHDGTIDTTVVQGSVSGQLVRDVPRVSSERFPDDFVSAGHRFRIGDTNGYIQLGFYPDGRPGALFLTGAKMGSTVQGLLAMVAVTASAALQNGVSLEELTHKWRGMKFEPSGITGDNDIRMTSSIADYIGRKLDRMAPSTSREADANLEEVAPGEYQLKTEYQKIGDFCPECHNELSYGEGCVLCVSCGYTRCG